MNVARSPRLTKVKEEDKNAGEITYLDFYAQPPHFELSLDEFEEYALARLKVR